MLANIALSVGLLAVTLPGGQSKAGEVATMFLKANINVWLPGV